MLTNEVKDMVLKMTITQRRELCNFTIMTIANGNSISRGERMIEIMDEILGESVMRKNRDARLVWGRAMIAFQLRSEGLTENMVGRILGKREATIFNLERKMADMMEVPEAYKDIMPIWVKFKEKINDIH